MISVEKLQFTQKLQKNYNQKLPENKNIKRVWLFGAKSLKRVLI